MSAPDPSSNRVLLVEDEPIVAVTLRDELEDAGYEVVVDQDGADAVDRLSRESFDCVVTDLRLPGADGRAVAAAAKARDPGTRVLVVTAHATRADAEELRGLGVVELVEKPFRNEDLVAQVARHLRPSG